MIGRCVALAHLARWRDITAVTRDRVSLSAKKYKRISMMPQGKRAWQSSC